MPDALPPVNASMLDHAEREVERALFNAKRGDEVAQRALLRFAASEALEAHLKRMTEAGDACAPTLDEIKFNTGSFSADACKLRYAVNNAHQALSLAAGRAVVVPLASDDDTYAPTIESTGDAA